MVLEGLAFDAKSVSISQVIAWIEELLIAAWTTFKPGGKLHPEAFIESKGHLVVEGLLLVVISYLLFQNGQKRPKTRKEERPLTEKVRKGASSHAMVLFLLAVTRSARFCAGN